jgi:hypothetical protein
LSLQSLAPDHNLQHRKPRSLIVTGEY